MTVKSINKAAAQALATGAVLMTTLTLSAVNAGDEVVVIYNSREPASKGIATYYAEKRQVPKEQVFGFELGLGEEISRAEFRDALQKPLAKKLEAGKLWRIGTLETPGTN